MFVCVCVCVVCIFLVLIRREKRTTVNDCIPLFISRRFSRDGGLEQCFFFVYNSE